jgi:CubicO group peptidase (beta-lactamase class C family)
MNMLKLCFAALFFFQCAPQQKIKRKKKKHVPRIEKVSYFPKFDPIDTRSLKAEKRYANRFFHQILDNDRFNGQFLVAKNGVVLYFQVKGFSNYALNKNLTKESAMHVASISKVATAVCVLRLADAKKIDLDADIRKYLPSIPYKGVTVRMLLNHRSGIPYYGYFTYNTWPLSKTLHNDDLVELIQKHKFPLNFLPDTKFAYSNTNFALLASIVEKVCRKKFPKVMQEWIFEPLEMKHTFILESESDLENQSRSYNESMVERKFEYLDAVYGDKNMYTTALDLLKFDRATYSNHFLSDSMRRQMFKGYSHEKMNSNNYGLGIRIKAQKDRETFFFHTGWWHGNTACYASLRSDTMCVIALSNVYTRSVYNLGMLAAKYGNYPFDYLKNPLD